MMFHVMKFLKSMIISRYRVPKYQVSEKSSKFAGRVLKWLCEKLNIQASLHIGNIGPDK